MVIVTGNYGTAHEIFYKSIEAILIVNNEKM